MADLTFYFNELFPTYEDWKITIQETDIVNYEDESESNFDKFCYKILSHHFSHSNIRYDSPEPFCLELINVYQSKFQQFKKQKELVDKIYKLTDEEINVINESINNMANNPNDEPSNPKEALDYISNQSFLINKNNKLKGYMEAIRDMPCLDIYSFINKPVPYGMSFNDLFIQILPNTQYLFER